MNLNQNPENKKPKPNERIDMKIGAEPVSLAQLLNQEVVLPVDEVLFLASETAMRLARLHTTGKIHGELTPDAIRINPTEISRNRNGRETQQVELGNSGVHFAAPESFEERLYLSPETRVGKSDERSDIYSLGCILCTCISGAPPFLNKADRIANHRDQLQERLSGVIGDSKEGVWLQQIIEWCVASEPQMRYRSAQQIVRDVNLIKLKRPPVGPRPKQESLTDSKGSFGKAVRRKLQHRLSVAAAIAASGIAIFGLMSFWGTYGALAPSNSATQSTAKSAMQLEVNWNKPADQYKIGDVFEYKINPKECAYIYSFYIKNDQVWNFYPSQKQKSNLVDTKGVYIDSFNDEVVLLVDQHEKGLLVTVGVPINSQGEKFELIEPQEYSSSNLIPEKLQLKMSSEKLFARIQELRERNPRAIVVIQKAPAAKHK